VKPEEDQTIWWIPLSIRIGPRLAREKPQAFISKSDIIQGIEDFYKINKDQCGFYRTNYPSSHLARLGQSLDLLSTEDKIGLVADAAALAVSGDSATAAILALLEGFSEEENYLYSIPFVNLCASSNSDNQGVVAARILFIQHSIDILWG
jgi:aminopeptidase N